MDNLRGSLLMVLAMAGFALEDMFIKAATATVPVGEALVIFGAGGTVIFAALTWSRGQRIVQPEILSRPILFRAGSEVVGRLGYTLGIALTPLSSASAILQATPLVVAAGAVIFFGEKVGWRRWVAIGAGFAGVLLILRPGLAGFDVLSLFAVVGMLGFAGRDLATRAAPPVLSNVQLGVYGFLMLIVAGVLILAVTGGGVWPAPTALAQLAAAILFGVTGYYALTAAMRLGEIAVVAPFRYTRLVFAMILGATVFAERPDMLTLLGSAVIVLSGLYTFFRRRKIGG